MTTLRLSLLGPPSITLGSESVNFESRKALALLAYLAARPGIHTRAEVAALLWPESDQRRARGALRYTLATIKHAVGDRWLEVDRRQLRLREGDDLVVDLHEFLAAREAAHDAAGARADADAIRHLTHAAALYRDDFLAGFTLRDSANFDEWQFFQTEQWRQRLVDVLTRLARLHTARREYAQAIHAAQRLTQLDPLREDVHRDLLALLLASGQTAAARQLYHDYAARLETELGIAPGPVLQDLLAAARQDADAPLPTDALPAARPHNLATLPGGFVGRERAQEEICATLRSDECRLLTLIGPGGMGKTRLAQQVADRLCHAPGPGFAQGVFHVALSGVTDQDALVAAMADALGFTFSGVKPPLTQLQGYLAARDCLVVLDNFEQLTPVGTVLSRLLEASPRLTVLVTSRARLQLYEEWVYGVGALEVPDADLDVAAADPPTLAAYSAVALFVQRARRTNPRFQLEDAVADVVRICRLVHGMPLALELAAGWTRLLSCRAIADQIEQHLDFLATEMRDVPARHRSLRATFASSWQRLYEEERRTFARLAVFRGGFDYAAAGVVAGATHLALARLIDQTMVQRLQTQAPFAGRLTIHEMLRQYAWAELDGAAQQEILRAHSVYFAGMLASHGGQRFDAAEAAALDQIQGEIDNILAAWHWLVAQLTAAPTAVDVAALRNGAPMLACFFIRRARFAEGEQLFGAAVAAVEQALASGERAPTVNPAELSRLHARLQLCRAEHLLNLSDFTRVAALADDVLSLHGASLEDVWRAEALWLAGTARVRMGVFDEAERLLAESLARFRAAGAEKASMLARNALGICFSNQGRYDEARVHYEVFLSLARQAAYTRGTANALNNLGSNYARAGDYTRALDLYRESYELALQTGEQLIIAVALSNLGSVSRALAEYDDARDFYARSLAITRNIGERRWTAANLNGLGLALADEGDDAAAANVLREGLEAALEISSTPDALDAIATLATLASRHAQTDLARDMLCLVAYHPVAMSSVRARARQALEDLGGTADDTLAEPLRDEDTVNAMAERARAFCERFPERPPA